MQRIYFDHAATTSVDPKVKKAMLLYLESRFGNPSSIFYKEGQETHKAIDESREKVAEFLNSKVEEIIFTSGGTESDNLALKGIFEANKDKGNHIIVSSVEHHAILHACQYLEKYHGANVTYLPVDKYGIVAIEDLKKAITVRTILVSIMYVNNEVGTIEPITEIGKLLKNLNKKRKNRIYFHTDAVQGAGYLDCDVQKLGVDALSMSAHKIYGLKGVGVLYLIKGIPFVPQSQGGVQEGGKRAGTENVAGIVGLAKAIELIKQNKKESKRVEKLRNKLVEGILKTIPDAIFTGPKIGPNRLISNASFCFKNVEGESLLISLDQAGIASSSGSACTSGSLDPSHVLIAMGLKPEVAHGSLRLTLGKENTESEVDYLLKVLPNIVKRLRAISPF